MSESGVADDHALRNAHEHTWIDSVQAAIRAFTARHPAARLALVLALLPAAGQASAVERVEAEAGVGNYVDVVGVGVASSDWTRWAIGKMWSISLYGEALAAYWRGRAEHTDNEDLVDLSVAPVLRLEHRTSQGLVPYLEASIGLHLLSHTRINEGRQFSTAFQFGEFLGAGVAFGPRTEYNLGLRVQHVSNGGIKNPNDGLTYGALVFQYQFARR